MQHSDSAKSLQAALHDAITSTNGSPRLLPAELAIAGTLGRKKLMKKASEPNDVTSSQSWMDTERNSIRAYEYLCHIGEAKEWIEACIEEEIGAITDLEEQLRNGIILAKLARFFEPTCVKRIFQDERLQFRHSDNTNFFFGACKKSGLPELFMFELTDVYDKKNMPKVIYCIHALSHFLTNKGIAPRIKNLVGKLDFTEEELQKTEDSLKEAGVSLPQFSNVEGVLALELQEDNESEEEKRQKYFEENERKVVKCQAIFRGQLVRKRISERAAHFASNQDKIAICQAAVRGHLSRKRINERNEYLKSHEKSIVKIQAFVRGRIGRRAFLERKQNWNSHLDEIVKIQSQFRGFQQRKLHQAKLQHYKSPESIAKITKVQACFRSRQLGNAYKSLNDLPHVSPKTIHQFATRLDSGSQDFEEELELEKLKQATVKQIRENNELEQLLADLDVKIALLVKNRISIDEIFDKPVKAKKISQSSSKSNSSTSMGNLSKLSSSSSFKSSSISVDGEISASSFKSLDKVSRHRQELYENLFYILQTRPKYLARAAFRIDPAHARRFMDNVLLTVFSFGNGAREEYLLLKFFEHVVKVELDSTDAADDFINGTALSLKCAVHHHRNVKDGEYIKSLLRPLITEVTGNEQLDLESDPVAIFEAVMPNVAADNVTCNQALQTAKVKDVFDKHVKDLKAYVFKFMMAIIRSVKSMPYGMRFIAKSVAAQMSNKGLAADVISKSVANLVYVSFIHAAIVAPDSFDIVAVDLSPVHTRNLREIAKCLEHIACNTRFSEEEDDEFHMAEAMNEFISDDAGKVTEFLNSVVDVPPVDDQFDLTAVSDVTNTRKPMIYLALAEVFNTHQLLHEIIMCDDDIDDPLRKLLEELGDVPQGAISCYYTGSVQDSSAQMHSMGDVSLTLSSRFIDDLSTEVIGGTSASQQLHEHRNLLIEAKRLILAVIRVHSGSSNLMELLMSPSSERDEQLYKQITDTAKEMLPHTLHELKQSALEALDALEMSYTRLPAALQLSETPISKSADGYQSVLASIGADIRNSHRRRIERRNEIRRLSQTRKSLHLKAAYLADQKKTYHDYINGCTAQLMTSSSTNSGKNSSSSSGGNGGARILSRQWMHMKRVKKTHGRLPQFGTFEYALSDLTKRGVIRHISDEFKRSSYMTISSDQTGIFDISIPSHASKSSEIEMRDELRLDDILQCQFDNRETLSAFDGGVEFDSRLLLGLVNKKFFTRPRK